MLLTAAVALSVWSMGNTGILWLPVLTPDKVKPILEGTELWALVTSPSEVCPKLCCVALVISGFPAGFIRGCWETCDCCCGNWGEHCHSSNESEKPFRSSLKSKSINASCQCCCCCKEKAIALSTINFTYLHYNKIYHVCEAISGYFVVLARNCLASTLDYIVMQMRKINREKGY